MALTTAMATELNVNMRPCPRCAVCNKAVRTTGVGTEFVWCKSCLAANLPLISIESERDYAAAVGEFREGLGTQVMDYEGMRFDPFGEEEREALKELGKTEYMQVH